MSRGDRPEDIFLNDVDRQDFNKTLAEDGLRLRAFEANRSAPMRWPGSVWLLFYSWEAGRTEKGVASATVREG